jgi:hypothetical protein
MESMFEDRVVARMNARRAHSDRHMLLDRAESAAEDEVLSWMRGACALSAPHDCRRHAREYFSKLRFAALSILGMSTSYEQTVEMHASAARLFAKKTSIIERSLRSARTHARRSLRLSARPTSTLADSNVASNRATSSPGIMDAFKAFVHRTKYLAAILEVAETRKRQRRFELHLRATIGAAVAWRTPEEPLRVARESVQQLLAIPAPPARKGSPSIPALRAPDLRTLHDALTLGVDRLDTTHLAAAARAASMDPADAMALRLYLAIWWLLNHEAIADLRAGTGEHIALHLTCAPRISRAERSIESFDAKPPFLTHVKLIGGGERLAYDRATNVLVVPSGDGYECLPQKMFHALAALTLARHPSCVLKLDDDHRLADAGALESLLQAASRAREALQFGEVNRTPLPSAHHRAWHLGKCGDAPVGSRPLEMPTPLKWATGSAGYVLNRAALWRVLWGSLYYARWLEEIVYEDVALAEVATKTGIRIVKTDMRRAIGTVSEY